MSTTSPQQPLTVEEYVREILNSQGFNELAPEDQESMFFDFMEQALIRLGAGLSPLLNDEGKKGFKALLDKNAPQAEWVTFWQKHVPSFGASAQKILEEYSKEVTQAFVKSP